MPAAEKLLSAAEQVGQKIFDSMQNAHFAAIDREEERGMIAFASRRKLFFTAQFEIGTD